MMRVIDVGNSADRLREAAHEAAAALKAGKIIAYITETVFGLACDAKSVPACDRLAELKGRGEHHPFPVQVPKLEPPWWDHPVPETASKLFRAFSPGPITVVVPADPSLAPRVKDARGTTAIRIPNHPVPQAILASFEGPVACPSANRTGEPPATKVEEIPGYLVADLALIVTGEPACAGMASTVVDVTVQPARVLRVGPVSEEEVMRCLVSEGS